jgi:hypothetical protein
VVPGVVSVAEHQTERRSRVSMFPATEPRRVNGLCLFVDTACGNTVTWSPEEYAEHGPIEEQGCDRCESGKANWVQVRVAL